MKKLVSVLTLTLFIFSIFGLTTLAVGTLEVSSFDANAGNITVNFSQPLDVATVNFDGISLTTSTGAKNVTPVMEDRDTLILNVSDNLEIGKVFDLQIPATFGDTTNTLVQAYNKKFALQEVFSDTFENVDKWKNGGGNQFRIQDGMLHMWNLYNYAYPKAALSNYSNWTDYTVEFDIEFYPTVWNPNFRLNEESFIIRKDGEKKVDKGNGYSIRLNNTDAATLQKVTNDTKSNLIKKAYSTTAFNDIIKPGVNGNTADDTSVIRTTPHPYKMKIQALGNNIKYYIDNKLVIDYNDTDSPITSGAFGFYGSSQAHLLVDNLMITKVVTPKEISITKINASKSAISVGFSGDLDAQKVTSNGISLTQDGVSKDVSVSIENGNTMIIKPTVPLELNQLISLNIPKNFGDGVSILSQDYTKEFALQSIFTDTFENVSQWKLTGQNSFKAQSGNMLHTYNVHKPAYPKTSLDNLANWKDYTAEFDMEFYPINTGVFQIYNERILIRKTGQTLDINKGTGYEIAFPNKDSLRLTKLADNVKIDEVTVSLNATGLGQGIQKGVNANTTDNDSVIRQTAVTYKMRIEAIGNNIKAYINDNLIIDYVDNNNPQLYGALGLWTSSGAELLMDNMYVTKMVEPSKVSVTGYKATKDEINVEFSDTIGDVSDFSKVILEDEGNAVGTTCTFSGNVLKIKPNIALTLDKPYDLTVGKGFGTSIVSTDNSFLKQFKITKLFSDEFAENINNWKITGGYNKYDWYNGKLYFSTDGANNAGGIYPNVAMADWNNYTVEYDLEFFKNPKNPNNTFWKTHSLQLNTQDTNGNIMGTKYVIQIEDNNCVLYCNQNITDVENQKPVELARESASNILGTGFKKGADGTTFSDGTLYKIKATILDNNIKYYINNKLIINYDVPTMYQIPAGGVQIYQLWNNIASVDNFSVTKFEELTPTLSFGKLTVKNSQNVDVINLDGLTQLSGVIDVKNYTQEGKNVRIIVAAYDKDNCMLSAKVITDAQSVVLGNETKSFNYSLNNLGAKAISMRIFAFNNFDDIKPYCRAVNFPK